MTRNLRGPLLLLTTIVLAAATLFHLWFVGVVGTLPIRVLTAMHLAFLTPVVFLLYPGRKGGSREAPPALLDYALAVASAALFLYAAFDYAQVEARIPMVTPVTLGETILGVLTVLIVIEATRRVVGIGLCLVVTVAILYLCAGSALPGIAGFPQIPFDRVIETLYLSDSDGVFGQLTILSATELILFITFGTFLAHSGIAEWFADVSTLLASRWSGGAAKLTVLYSMLFGSVSGSPTADLYTTGPYTIPLMKKSGFSPSFAAGLAAASTTGSQIMPPVMGASALVMAALLSRSFFSIVVAALPAALLFFLAKWTAAHCEAKVRHIAPLELAVPSLRSIFARSFYLIPILGLLVTLYLGYSPSKAAMAGTVLAVLTSLVRKETRLSPRRLVQTLAAAARGAIFVALPCAAAGVIVASLTATGLGLSMTTIILDTAHGVLIAALVLVALAAIVLGIGVPTTPAYILIAVVAVPALQQMGVNAFAAHMFVLYFAVLSSIHPPVGITAYAAAAIADAPPMRTGILAFLIVLPGFAVPFGFVYHPAILLEGATQTMLLEWLFIAVSVTACSAAIWGYGLRPMGTLARIVTICGGIALVAPSLAANLAGLAAVAAVFALQWAAPRPAVVPVLTKEAP